MKEAVHSTKDQQRRKQRVKGKQAKTGKMLQLCGFFLQKPDFPIGKTKLYERRGHKKAFRYSFRGV
jgi:hypothetical protein